MPDLIDKRGGAYDPVNKFGNAWQTTAPIGKTCRRQDRQAA